MKTNIRIFITFLLVLFSQQSFSQFTPSNAFNPSNAEIGVFYDTVSYNTPFTKNILDVRVYDNNRAFFAVADTSRILVYNPSKPSIYQIIKFNTNTGNVLYGKHPTNGEFAGQNADKTQIKSLDIYPKNKYRADADKKYIHGVLLAKNGENSYIHNFVYDTANTNNSNFIYMYGITSSAVDGLNLSFSDFSTNDIQKVAITNVYYSSYKPNNSFTLPYNVRHNAWAVGKGICKYFDGTYWVDFSNNANLLRSKSTGNVDFYQMMGDGGVKNQNIINNNISNTVLFSSIYVLDTANVWVGGSDGVILKINHFGLATSTSGISFTPLTSPTGGADTIKGIYFATTSLGWVCTNTGKLFETTNSGGSWILKSTNNGANFNAMVASNNSTPTSPNLISVGSSTSTTIIGLSNYSNASNWKDEDGLNKAYSLESIKPDFNSAHFANSSATDSLGFLVGDNGYILKVPDTNVLVFKGVTKINSTIVQSSSVLDFMPKSTGTIALNANYFWLKDSTPYLKMTAPIPGYRKPYCIDDASSDVSTCGDSAIFANVATTLISQYPNYNNTAPAFNKLYNYSSVVNAFAKRISVDPVPIGGNKYDDVILTYEATNYNFSLDTNFIDVPFYSSGYGAKMLRIAQKPFVPSIITFPTFITPLNYNTTVDKYSAVAKAIDTFAVNVLGAFKVTTFPKSYYDIKIDNTTQTIDTTIFRKASQQTLVGTNIVTPNDTIRLISKFNFINSAPIGTQSIDTAYVTLTAPCKNDGSACASDSKKISIFKAPLLLGVTNNKTIAAAPSPTSFKLNGDNNFNFIAPEYNDYTSSIIDSVQFCPTGKLKNLSATATETPCYNSVADDANYYVSTYGHAGLKYKVYVKYDQATHFTTDDKKSRYKFQMIANPDLVFGEASVRPIALASGGFSTIPSPITTNDTLYSKSCLDSDTLSNQLTCNTKGNIDLRFKIIADSFNNTKFKRRDTLTIELEGYDNTLTGGKIDTSIKKRSVKLLVIVQDKFEFNVMYSKRPLPIPNVANDSVDTALPVNIDDSVKISGILNATPLTKNDGLDSFAVKSSFAWEYRKIDGISPLNINTLVTWADTTRSTDPFNKSVILLPYSNIKFYPKQSNLSTLTRKDSFNVCVISSPVCKKIILIQEAPKLFVMRNFGPASDSTDTGLPASTSDTLIIGAVADVFSPNSSTETKFDTLNIKSDYSWEFKSLSGSGPAFPTWLDTVVQADGKKNDSGNILFPYFIKMYKPNETNFTGAKREADFKVCLTGIDICKKVHVIQNIPQLYVMHNAGSGLHDSIDAINVPAGIDNQLKVEGVASADITKVTFDSLYIRSSLEWEFKPLSGTGSAFPTWLDTVAKTDGKKNDSGNFIAPYYLKVFRPKDTNFTGADRTAEFNVCIKGAPPSSCKKITVTQKDLVIKMPTLVYKPSTINCVANTLCPNDAILWLGARPGKKMNVEGRNEFDSTQDIYIQSNYEWEIRAIKDGGPATKAFFDLNGNPTSATISLGFPDWIGIDSKYPLPTQVTDSGNMVEQLDDEAKRYRRVNFKTIKANNLASQIKKDTFSVCLRGPFSTPKCLSVFAEQAYLKLDVKFIGTEDKGANNISDIDGTNPDSMNLRHRTTHVDSIEVQTDDYFTVTYLTGNASVAIPSSKVQERLDPMFKNTAEYSNSDTIGNTKLFFSPRADNSGSKKTDSIKICLKEVPSVCKQVLILQDTARLKVVYQTPGKDSFTFAYKKEILDSLYVVYDDPIEFRTYSGGAWVNTPTDLSTQSNINFLDSVTVAADINLTTSTGATFTLIADPSTHKMRFQTKNINLLINQIKDSFKICFAGSTTSCRLIKFTQDTPAINLSFNKLGKDSVLFTHKKGVQEISNLLPSISSNADWEWQTGGGGAWVAGISTLIDTSLTQFANSNNKDVLLLSRSKNYSQIIRRDSMRACVVGITKVSSIDQQNKYCKTLRIIQDTAKLKMNINVDGRTRGDTLYLSFNNATKDSLNIEANDTFEVYSMNQAGVTWVDTSNKETALNLKSSTGTPSTTGYREFVGDTGNLVLKSILSNGLRAFRYGTISIKIKGTNIIKTFVVAQDTPFLRLLTKFAYLGRRVKERMQILGIESNTGWQLVYKLGKLYDFKEIGGDNNFVYNQSNNYDSSNSTLEFRSLQSNESFTRSRDVIYIQTRDGDFKDSIIVIQDSAFLNFSFNPNSIGYPIPNETDSAITVEAKANQQFKANIFGNIAWKVVSPNWTSKNKWNELVLPLPNFVFTSDTNIVILKSYDNTDVASVFPRIDTVYIICTLNGVEQVFLRFKILQDPILVPDDQNYIIFPQPIKNTLVIKSKNFIAERAAKGYVYLYDLNGNLIVDRPFTNGIIDFDFGVLSIGYYILKVYDGNIYFQQMILKE